MKAISLPALCLLLPALHAQTFQLTSQPLATPVLGGKIAIGDVDGDGHPDLVHAGWTTACMLAGQPGGVFAAPVPLPAPWLCSDVQLVDSNGDGRLDVWRCDGVGCTRFEWSATGLVPTASLGQARSMAFADFDEDGDVDVVIGADAGLALARGDGQGGFLPPVTFAPLAVMAYTQCARGDLDGDGHQDLVVCLFAMPPKVFFGNGAGQFTMQSLPMPGVAHVCLADVDGDGDLDVVGGVTATSTNVVVAINNGLGQFSTAQPVVGFATNEPLAADFDGDGRIDLVGTNGAALQLLLGVGGGQFAPPLAFPTGYLYGLVVGDIDGDGRVEATAIMDTSQVRVLRLVDPTPPGLAMFGSGTPACAGTIGMRGTTEPLLGATDFRVQCTNAPQSSTGLLAIGTAVPAGWQPLGLGLTLHLRFAWPVAAMHSDVGGTASLGLALPSSPILSGLTAHLQSIWLADAGRGDTCSTAAYELASSRALSLTLH